MLFQGSIPVPAAEPHTDRNRSVDPHSGGANELSATGEVDASRPETILRLSSGQVLSLPTELLLQGMGAQASRTPSAPVAPGSSTPANALQTADTGMTIPLLAEQLEVGKRTVTTGTVRLHKGVETFTQDVSLPLTRTGWDVQRIPVGQLMTERPEVRQEGEVTVFPLVEERLVAKREYFLLEEVRIRRVELTTERTASLELKRDVLTVDREPAPDAQQS